MSCYWSETLTSVFFFKVSHLFACLRRITTTRRLPTLVWATAWSARSPTNPPPPCSTSTPTPERSPPQKQVIAELGALSGGMLIICLSLSVIWSYSATVNPDYTAHLGWSRLKAQWRHPDRWLLWVCVSTMTLCLKMAVYICDLFGIVLNYIWRTCVLWQGHSSSKPGKASVMAEEKTRALMLWGQSLTTTVQCRRSPSTKTPSSPAWKEQVRVQQDQMKLLQKCLKPLICRVKCGSQLHTQSLFWHIGI